MREASWEKEGSGTGRGAAGGCWEWKRDGSRGWMWRGDAVDAEEEVRFKT